MSARTLHRLRLGALALTALALVPAGAHLFELPGKMALGRDAYLAVQGIYAGWALFGLPIFAAIAAHLALAVGLRRAEPAAARRFLAAALLMTAGMAVFFAFVFPANRATADWTMLPAGWEALRLRWEYGHAANALFTAAAFVAAAAGAVRR